MHRSQPNSFIIGALYAHIEISDMFMRTQKNPEMHPIYFTGADLEISEGGFKVDCWFGNAG